MAIPSDKSPSPLIAGLLGRCPRCGKGRLFQGFLALRPRCEHCGIHCGFEPSAAYEASRSLKETVRSLAWTLTG